MESLIFEFKNIISKELCKEIIEKFNLERHNDGQISNGVNKEIKDTKDYWINFFKTEQNQQWEKINEILFTTLQTCLKEYINYFNSNYSNEEFKYFKDDILSDDGFLIQVYKKEQGKYEYHEDFSFDIDKNRARIITFIIYLNDIEVGGETEFWGKYKIKPEVGKLILFPSNWCFMHKGIMPVSHNKYIITGWIYIHYGKVEILHVKNV